MHFDTLIKLNYPLLIELLITNLYEVNKKTKNKDNYLEIVSSLDQSYAIPRYEEYTWSYI